MRPFFNPADINNVFDFNRDRLVNALDAGAARIHATGEGMSLALIAAPAVGAPGMMTPIVPEKPGTAAARPEWTTTGYRINPVVYAAEARVSRPVPISDRRAPQDSRPLTWQAWSPRNLDADNEDLMTLRPRIWLEEPNLLNR